MKLRYVLVALALAATAACQSSPTAPDTSRATPSTAPVLREETPTPTPTPTDPTSTDASRGGGAMGSGG